MWKKIKTLIKIIGWIGVVIAAGMAMKREPEVVRVGKNRSGGGNDEERKEYVGYRRDLTEAANTYALFFDRAFIYILTAVLAFSLHFIYNNDMPVNTWTFIFWGLMIAAIIFFVFGYKFVNLAYERAINILDESVEKGEDPREIKNPFDPWYKLFDWAAIICFGSGFILMFVYLCVVYLGC